MIRNVGAIVAGLIAWVVVATVLDRAMRFSWPQYSAAIPVMAFTLQMKFARLTEGAITTVVAGFTNRLIARASLWPAVAQGFLTLLFFVPIHYKLWHKFPVWYHVTFLGYLTPLTVLGAALAPRRIARAKA